MLSQILSAASIELFVAVFVTFFVIIDPVGVAPLFASLTRGTPASWRRRMAAKSVFVATGILVSFAFGGGWLLDKMHVSLDAFRIAGGLLLFLIAIDMLFEKQTQRREQRNEKILEERASHPDDLDDISVFPLAIPLIAGPGAIASVILYFTENQSPAGRIAVLLGLGANLVLTLAGFLAAGTLTRWLGHTFSGIITRIFGIILAALAAQFVLDGLHGAFGIAKP